MRLLLLLAACAGAPADPPNSSGAPPDVLPVEATPAEITGVWVFLPTGALQCEEGSGVTEAEARARLVAAGAPPQSYRSADDGMMLAAVCGAPDGSVHAFEVPPHTLEKAIAAGFDNTPPGG